MTATGGESRRVIILGASPNRRRMSNKAVRAYLELGYTIYPVHPGAETVEGCRVWPSIDSVPDPVPLLLLYVRPEIGLTLLSQARERGIRRIFVNPGTGSPELLARIRAEGMEAIEECAILAVGKRPAEYPD